MRVYDDLRKRLMLSLTLTSDIMDTIDQWRDRLRSCVHAGGFI